MIRDENSMLAGYVYVDITGRDVALCYRSTRTVREKINFQRDMPFSGADNTRICLGCEKD